MTSTPKITTSDAGSSRRNRRDQKALRPMRPLLRCSPMSSTVMRNPDSVKNVETDRNAPGANENPAWKKKIAISASPRRPSSAGW